MIHAVASHELVDGNCAVTEQLEHRAILANQLGTRGSVSSRRVTSNSESAESAEV